MISLIANLKLKNYFLGRLTSHFILFRRKEVITASSVSMLTSIIPACFSLYKYGLTVCWLEGSSWEQKLFELIYYDLPILGILCYSSFNAYRFRKLSKTNSETLIIVNSEASIQIKELSEQVFLEVYRSMLLVLSLLSALQVLCLLVNTDLTEIVNILLRNLYIPLILVVALKHHKPVSLLWFQPSKWISYSRRCSRPQPSKGS